MNVPSQSSEFEVAANILNHWLPFLSQDLCSTCINTLHQRIHAIASGDLQDVPEFITNQSDCSPKSLESGKNSCEPDHDSQDVPEFITNQSDCSPKSLESGKNSCEPDHDSAANPSPTPRMSWADMVQEEELEDQEEVSSQSWGDPIEEVTGPSVESQQKPVMLSRDDREYLRFMRVVRKKDFICLERVNGKIVNILGGLELHVGVFSLAEQKRIINHVDELQEMGRKGQLRECTYTSHKAQGRGAAIQFGCCYNSENKYGTSQGIIRDEDAEPIPHLFKVIIKRLIGWHVLPPNCIPNSCVVDIYDEGDFMPPLIDHHDFVRPLCTLSLLNECSILFGTNLQCVEPGVFEGPMALPLPIGSVLVLNGNSADVAKHCMPAVPSKRISITFKKMDNRRLPFSFVPEPDLRTIQPLPYNTKGSRSRRPQKSRNAYPHGSPQIAINDHHVEEQRSNFPRGGSHVVNRPRPRPRPRPHRSNP